MRVFHEDNGPIVPIIDFDDIDIPLNDMSIKLWTTSFCF